MGKGYVFQYAEKWQEAEILFSQAAKQLPEDMDKGLRAKEEGAWCLSRMRVDAGADALKDVFETLKDIDDREIGKARCLWRIGRCYWDMGGITTHFFVTSH